METIGIFWVYNSTVIGKARKLKECEETCPGMLDSPDSHVELWRGDTDIVLRFPELREVEYQDVPRGRVVYSTQDNRPIVYMDAVLSTEKTKRAIAAFFQFGVSDAVWEKDMHYTTDADRISALFD